MPITRDCCEARGAWVARRLGLGLGGACPAGPLGTWMGAITACICCAVPGQKGRRWPFAGPCKRLGFRLPTYSFVACTVGGEKGEPALDTCRRCTTVATCVLPPFPQPATVAGGAGWGAFLGRCVVLLHCCCTVLLYSYCPVPGHRDLFPPVHRNGEGLRVQIGWPAKESVLRPAIP